MKKLTNTTKTRAPKAAAAGTEPELGNAQGITINDSTEVIKPAEEARQEQMKTDLKKIKAGEKKMKASVKAAKASKATLAKAAKVAKNPKAKAPKPATVAKAAGSTKKDQVLALIGRKNGATLNDIMITTGWLKHSVRGFISILGKKGTKIESSKSEAGARTYKAA